MGYYLLYESMLDSVIVCWDWFLKKNGMMFPNIASIYIAGCDIVRPGDHLNKLN